MQDNKYIYGELEENLSNASDDLVKCFVMCGELDGFLNMPNATEEDRSWIACEHKRVITYYNILLDYMVSLRSIIEEMQEEIRILAIDKEE